MERVYIIGMLILANFAYIYDMSNKWKETSDDGIVGRWALGFIILVISTVIVFNLGLILNS